MPAGRPSASEWLAAVISLASLLAAAVVLAVVAVVAGRYALRRTPGALRVAASGRPAPPASHPVLIMNLKSGGGRAERYHLAEECRERGIEPVILRPGDELFDRRDLGLVARGLPAAQA